MQGPWARLCAGRPLGEPHFLQIGSRCPTIRARCAGVGSLQLGSSAHGARQAASRARSRFLMRSALLAAPF
eukprot:12478596-Alexandrium_andersonii.AAC.1